MGPAAHCAWISSGRAATVSRRPRQQGLNFGFSQVESRDACSAVALNSDGSGACTSARVDAVLPTRGSPYPGAPNSSKGPKLPPSKTTEMTEVTDRRRVCPRGQQRYWPAASAARMRARFRCAHGRRRFGQNTPGHIAFDLGQLVTVDLNRHAQHPFGQACPPAGQGACHQYGHKAAPAAAMIQKLHKDAVPVIISCLPHLTRAGLLTKGPY